MSFATPVLKLKDPPQTCLEVLPAFSLSARNQGLEGRRVVVIHEGVDYVLEVIDSNLLIRLEKSVEIFPTRQSVAASFARLLLLLEGRGDIREAGEEAIEIRSKGYKLREWELGVHFAETGYEEQ